MPTLKVKYASQARELNSKMCQTVEKNEKIGFQIFPILK